MKLLLIEDDEPKKGRIVELLERELRGAQVIHKRSYQSGLRELLRELPDLVLLDMNLPNYDITDEEPGGRIQQFAGREFLRQLNRRKIKVPVIVVTAFDNFGDGDDEIDLNDLNEELIKTYSENYIGYVIPKHRSVDIDEIDDWKLAEKLYGK